VGKERAHHWVGGRVSFLAKRQMLSKRHLWGAEVGPQARKGDCP